jgi:predicted amidohydrolase
VQPAKIPVASVQARAHDRADFERAWPRLAGLIAQAGQHRAKLIVLPEGTVPAYVLGSERIVLSQLESSAARIGALARQYEATIVYGGVKLENGKALNAAIAVGPDGRELGFAAKTFLWHFDRRWFAPGTRLEPVDTPAGRLGLLVCADGRIPTIAATLVERGAQMLVMPTAWVTSGRDPRALENVQADLMASVRARENRVPFVIANKCGVEGESVAYCGKSAVIDANGDFVARASERDEEIVYGEIALATPRAVAGDTPLDGTRRDGASAPLRVAFTTARGPEIERFSALAAQADADVLVARAGSSAAAGASLPVLDATLAGTELHAPGGATFLTVDSATARDPRGLIGARLRGIDAFVWTDADDPAWDLAFARTRAAELRAYLIVFGAERAFAVDPEGTVTAGTFDDYRLAAFAYDPARAAAATVAPATNVLAGLREAERIRAV